MPPRKHPERVKTMACRVCGLPVIVSLYRGKPVRCVSCASDAMAAAAREISAKSGPYYERWLVAGGANGRPKGRG